MTIIGDSYTALVNIIKNTLSSWYRLTDPNDISNNFDAFLRQGWSLIADSSQNVDRYLCSISTWNRTYMLTLSVEAFGTNSDDDLYDDSVKKLLEAINLVCIAIESDQTIAVSGGNVIARVTNDSGVLPVSREDKKFIMCELKIDVETRISF